MADISQKISNLPTPQQILERVKAQDWGHDWKDQNCSMCGEKIIVKWGEINNMPWCPVRIAQAIQAAMVETMRYIAQQLGPCNLDTIASVIKEAADALEKSIAK